MLNRIILMGRLCADPELRSTQNDVPVTTIRIAVERDYVDGSGERATDFFDVVAWRGTAEFVCRYFSKGRMIAVEGRLQPRQWTAQDGSTRVAVEVVADNVYFADSKPAEPEAKKSHGRKKAA